VGLAPLRAYHPALALAFRAYSRELLMRIASNRVLLAVLVSVAVPVLAADLVKPDIKPGLWEVTTNPHVSGQMPIPDDQLAKMTPEQRARLDAAIKASQARSGKPRVYKECMTPEKIARGFDMDKESEGSSCKRNVVSSSANELTLHDECAKPDGKTSTDVHFEIKSGTQMNGKINVVMSSGTKTMTVNSTVQGKWLGADCGNVKDAELQK
jgi:hypothetical protein